MLAELQAVRRQVGQTDRCAESAKADAAKAHAKTDVLQRQVTALEAQVYILGDLLYDADITALVNWATWLCRVAQKG